jgi:hypothetical protein
MAIRWIDGFEHYGTGTTGKDNMVNYGAYAQGGASSISSTRARSGTLSLRAADIRFAFAANLTAVGVGCAIYLDSLPGADVLNYFEFRDNSGNVLCRFGLSNSQEFVLYRANSVEIGRSSPGQVTAGGWYHYECKFTPNGATSSIELRINEVTVYSNNSFPIGSTLGPGNTATSTASVDMDIAGVSFTYLDDFYVWDTSGSYNTDFIGDKRVATMFPNGDTAEADWSPNSGATGYTQIDEAAPDGDTTYVQSTTVGDLSEYDFEAMPANAIAINAVMTFTAARKTDTGTCDIRTDIVSNASATTGATKVLTTGYVYGTNVFETDPNTGALWTKAGVDAAKIRIEREA